ncbi:MAG: Ig-like domain-containing protein, partial [Muribaculaceae bacterium]|nr:Ig-like domain-containing protein [Muribaculaceae bacterium]
DKVISCTSSDETVATVDENGLVTAVADGTAVITVKSLDGNTEASCTVTVDSTFNGVNSLYSEDIYKTEVYNLSGYKVSDSVENLAPGIYIVKQGAKTSKISIK